MTKVVEKHITLLPETHDKLKAIAKKQRRSMRAVVTKWVEDEVENANSK